MGLQVDGDGGEPLTKKDLMCGREFETMIDTGFPVSVELVRGVEISNYNVNCEQGLEGHRVPRMAKSCALQYSTANGEQRFKLIIYLKNLQNQRHC